MNFGGPLAWTVFAPALGALLVLLAPTARMTKHIALVATAATLILSAATVTQWMIAAQRVEDDTLAPPAAPLVQCSAPWIHMRDFQVNFTLGVDGLSAPLVLLTALITLLAVAGSWNFEQWKLRQGLKGYLALLLILETAILGVFTALDFFLFYVFFELMLVPMYFLVGIWGGPRREYAAIKFFLYTLVGSVLLLIVMLAIWFYAPAGLRTFDFIELSRPGPLRAIFEGANTRFLGFAFGPAMFLLAFLAFAIKLPLVPLHTWLPDAHVEAPTPVSMILAALLLKAGGYGLIRINYAIFPAAGAQFAFWLALAGVIAILYGALCTLAQRDLKRLVAYSSVSHMGYVLLGLAAWNATAVQGAIFQMVAHGISSAMCFFLVGVIQERVGHRDIDRLGGLWLSAPRLGGLASIAFFATMGLPTLCGFVGEVLIILGVFQSRTGLLGAAAIPLGLLAACGTILAAAYVLWMMQRVFLGPRRAERAQIPDLDRRETAILAPLAALCFLLGLLPQQTVLHFLDGAVRALLMNGN